MKKLALLALALAGMHGALADGGAIVAQETLDGMQVTVFAGPAPLRAGPADISVLLQDEKSGEPILDQTVTVSLTAAAGDGESWVPPCCSMENMTHAVPALRAHAQNKLLYAANVIVPSSGPVDLVVRIGKDPTVLVAQVEARPPLPPVAAYWPYLVLPPFAIGAFALNRHLRRR